MVSAAIRAADAAVRLLAVAREIQQVRKEVKRLREAGLTKQATALEVLCKRAERALEKQRVTAKRRARAARRAPRDTRGRFA